MTLPPKDVRYIDRPELAEIYVDSLGALSYENHIAKLELCVTRLDEPTDPPTKTTARKYPACRLAMPLQTLVRLHNRLAETLEALEKEGLLRGGDPRHPEKN